MPVLEARRIYVDDRQSIIVVESIDVRHERCGKAHGLLARLAPIAVVIAMPDRARALDMNADPVDLDRLLDEVGNLPTLLEP